MSSTVWLLNNREKKEHLGVSFVLVTPSGNFNESQVLNSSENRYKYILNMGYIKPLNEKFTFEFSPEIAFYGENKTKTTTIKQKPSFAFNTNLRYRINRSYEIFGGYQYSYNSETSINGISQNNQHSSNKFSLGGFYYTQNHHQFMVRYAKENSKEFGMKVQDEVLLRYRWWF